ncbi:MAG: hypothetical protein E6Q37_05865 [Crocinitomicaceae bacterium]|nr:MAG: hypothetical protein E6Q37_05865 [Crocinitomicaceae bacterium]
MGTKSKLKSIHWFEKQAQYFENNRFGAMALMMTAQSCWGSIVAMFALKTNSLILLSICAAVTMASNSAFIAQSPAKWSLAVFYGSLLVNLLILPFTFI